MIAIFFCFKRRGPKKEIIHKQGLLTLVDEAITCWEGNVVKKYGEGKFDQSDANEELRFIGKKLFDALKRVSRNQLTGKMKNKSDILDQGGNWIDAYVKTVD